MSKKDNPTTTADLGLRAIFMMARGLNVVIDGINTIDQHSTVRIQKSVSNKKNRQQFVDMQKSTWLGDGKKPRRYIRTDKPLINQVGPDAQHVRPDTTHEMSWRKAICASLVTFFMFFLGLGRFKTQDTVKNCSKTNRKEAA